MPKQYTKPALSFEQQLAQLQQRGMQVVDVERAVSALRRISYYRLSAYWYPFKRTDDTFEPGTTFEEAIGLYEFDRKLRLLVLDAIERVEVELRTSVTYVLGHSHGAFAHEEAKRFAPTFDHAKWHAETFLAEVLRSAEKESFLVHFKTNYSGFPAVPIWMASEVMSLGTLSRLFKGMRTQDQKAVVDRWGLHQSVAESWFHSIAYVRNVCAHHARLWNRDLAIKPTIPRRDSAWTAIVNNRRIFAVLCMLRQLTRDHGTGNDWCQQAITLMGQMSGKPPYQNAMGMPTDWLELDFWAAPATVPSATNGG